VPFPPDRAEGASVGCKAPSADIHALARAALVDRLDQALPGRNFDRGPIGSGWNGYALRPCLRCASNSFSRSSLCEE
jgi:hypothetical protein